MAATKRTLEEGLDNSANKKGLTGKERHRYIGGAIRNMEKRGEFTIKRKPAKPKPPKASRTVHKADTRGKGKVQPSTAHKPTVAAPKPTKQAYSKPTVTKKEPEKPREKLELEVKKNTSRSTATKSVYSIYNKKTGALHGSFASTKRQAVALEAQNEMYAYNHPKGIHTRNRF